MTKKTSGHEDPAHWELTELPVAPAGAKPADDNLQEIIRKNYREPIIDDDPVSVEINGRTHRVCDIGNRGLGLIVPCFGGFVAGSLHAFTLQLSKKSISLQGTVTHVSPIEASGECHCGIEFIGLSPEDEHTLQNFLTAHHARLFNKTSLPAAPDRD